MSLYSPNTVMNFLDDELELGASKKPKKKKKRKLGAKIKKGLKKVAKVAVTGGASLAIDAIKKSKAGKKVKEIAKKVSKAAPVRKSASAALKAARVVADVNATKAGDCASKDQLAKLVAAKVVAKFGPPIDEANKILAKFELQRQATYEHKKLMQDSEFRKKVLGYIAGKARRGNCACKRALLNLGA